MNKTGFLYDDRYLLHDTGPYHPEMAERLQAVNKGIRDGDLLTRLTLVKADKADMQWIEAVHTRDYINRFEEVCLSGSKMFDYPDNQLCSKTYETALLAVGGILKTVDKVMTGEIDNAFCAVRPPGHHAEADKAMGFCYFNNVAIAARYLRRHWNMQRVGILDFDVHHGNGTQHVFEDDPTVFYYSIHEHPSFAFPGTGRTFENGKGPGVGYTRNYPVLPGQDDAAYEQIMDNDCIPAFEHFKPEVILLSTGFDAHVDDDMSGINLSTPGFSAIMEKMMGLAAKHSNGRLISILEGGYSLERLPELARNHVEILMKKKAR